MAKSVKKNKDILVQNKKQRNSSGESDNSDIKKNNKKPRDKKNVCKFCGWKTFWLSALKSHIKCKHILEKYVCGHCSMTFTRFSNGVRHSKNVHANLEQLICLEEENMTACDQQLNRTPIEKNVVAMEENIVNEKACEKHPYQVQNVNETNLPIISNRPSEELDTSMICLKCSFVGNDFDNLFQHLTSCHFDSNVIYSDAELVVNQQSIESSVNGNGELEHCIEAQFDNAGFICHQCNRLMQNKNEYLQHIEFEHIPKLMCTCGILCDGHEGLVAHMQSTHITLQSCGICSEQFIGFRNLQLHVIDKHSE